MINLDIQNAMKWTPAEYVAGYHARLYALPTTISASHSWQCGWNDANVEALESARHMRSQMEDGGYANIETWDLLFEAGNNARINGIVFEEGLTEYWKKGWIAADISLGRACRPIKSL
ncbi:hypothetical protein HDF16_004106 [Granulicella aggregans]|uniref:Uncharacterized protein n=1 Tax=Granulicella aggregans TaxID=474949 RepID=A0A7W7ZGM5_9BACT|nr:hypothetical protein [Granulicella aggregans]MBB5059383.1 hypothetical protein [Granulicella aggregans]